MAFVKKTSPVLLGQKLAGFPRLNVGDPSVIRVGSRFEMYVTTAYPEQETAAIALATSTNGTSWTWAKGTIKSAVKGLVYAGAPGLSYETPCVVMHDGKRRLYAARYIEDGSVLPPGEIFVDVPTRPSILSPTPGTRDASACYSPSVAPRGNRPFARYPNGWVMAYAGHGPNGVSILAATSPDGLVWTKSGTLLVGSRAGFEWMVDGVSEPCLFQGPGGQWYLCFVGERGEERVIGLAVGPTPLGPFAVRPQPIIVPSKGQFDAAGCLAPSVLLPPTVGAKVLCFYHGQRVQDGEQSIGLATASWPL